MNKIGIIGAMELEVAELKSKMTLKNVVDKAGMKFHEGVLNGKDVVIVQCGIGKVNAGICDLFAIFTHRFCSTAPNPVLTGYSALI